MKLRLPASQVELIKKLHPDIKKKIRNGLEELLQNPDLGKELRDELLGWRSYRIHKYRIVYRIHGQVLEIACIGPRISIYEDTLKILKKK